MKIVIPSYQRYNVQTIALLGELPYTLFVANQNEYDKYNYTNKVIGKLGIVQQRNFITNYFDEGEIIVSLDDDITEFIHREGLPFKEWILECVSYLEQSKLQLMSFPPSSNEYFCKGAKFSEGKYLAIGSCHIYKNDKQLLTIPFVEDYERSLFSLRKYGAVIRCGNVCIKTKMFATGGLSNERTRESYMDSIYKLMHKFPEDLSYNIKKNGMMKGLANIKILKKQQPVCQMPEYDLSYLFPILEETKMKTMDKRLGFPTFKGMLLGVVRERGKRDWGLSAYTKRNPELWEMIKEIGNKIAPGFTQCQINKNLQCPKHKDRSNTRKSVLISLGDYLGGKIVIEDAEYDALNRPTIFDGKMLEHYNTPHVGTKYSLIFF